MYLKKEKQTNKFLETITTINNQTCSNTRVNKEGIHKVVITDITDITEMQHFCLIEVLFSAPNM